MIPRSDALESADQFIPAHSPSARTPKSRPARAATRTTGKILRSDIASLELRFQAEKVSNELRAGITKPTNETNPLCPTPCRIASPHDKIDGIQLRRCKNVPPNRTPAFWSEGRFDFAARQSVVHKTHGKRPRGRMDQRGEKARHCGRERSAPIQLDRSAGVPFKGRAFYRPRLSGD